MFTDRPALTLLLTAACLTLAPCHAPCQADQLAPRLAKLVDQAKDKKCFVFTDWDITNPLTERDVPVALGYVKSHPDYTAYFLVLVLRTHYPQAYRELRKEMRAAVLCSALERAHGFNDWSVLHERDSLDKVSARTLLDSGKVALQYLKPLLDNDKPALLYGSQAATLSIACKYRVKDFAYRYALLILGERPSFGADPATRDKAIAALKATLKKNAK
jgi:hypothetical protein